MIPHAVNFAVWADHLRRPPLFERSVEAFWDDPYVSSQLLQAHLDPSHDAASRQPATIDWTVAWLKTHLALQPGMRLLDLGCGPGLYCRRFAQAGLQVSGIDYSRRSIAYATEDAVQHDLPITYRYGNYLELNDEDAYDVISLIYFDFGTLTEEERACLLPRIWRALKPGGWFVFDVRTSTDFTRQREACTWALCPEGGFWHAGPYLELKATWLYPEAETILDQYAIVSEAGDIRIYRIWERCFSTQTITALLAQHGFILTSVWSDLTGDPWDDASPGMGVLAVKEKA